MPTLWALKLHQNNLKLQSTASISTVGMEDTGSVHGGISLDRCDLRFVSLN